MKKYKKVEEVHMVVAAVFCNKCKKLLSTEDRDESWEIQFIGGYYSVWGDGAKVSIDLCQECAKELLGEYCHVD